MADSKPTSHYYNNLGGINIKASTYEMNIAQFLDLRNLDFDVPKALQKRPGQTYAITSTNGSSGPISSVFEYQQLEGYSVIVVGDHVAQRYIANNGYTLLSSGWSNGQPIDMLTFVNKLWSCNGSKWEYAFSTSGLSQIASNRVGLPIESRSEFRDAGGATLTYASGPYQGSATGGTFFTVNGATMFTFGGSSSLTRGIYIAYSYVRSDGYIGPIDFQGTARNIVRYAPTNAQDFFDNSTTGFKYNELIGGFTTPSGNNITSIAIFFAEDTIGYSAPMENIPGVGIVESGALGWRTQITNRSFMSYTLKPGADLSRFWLYTTIPVSNLFLQNNTNATYYGVTFTLGSTWGAYDGSAPPTLSGLTLMPFDFFSTYIPKYQEVNQNFMFISGFSSQPSQLWFSEVGEPEVYDPESVFEVRTNDGDRITGIKAYSDQLIVCKDHSFSKVIGNSADNFQLINLSSDYGCISNRSIVTNNQKMYWLDKKGILEYNGASWDIISEPIEAIFRRMNLSAARENACGVHHLYRNQIWWGIPVDSSTKNNITVVYDYFVGAWTLFDGFDAASFTYAKSSLNKPTVYRGDYSGLVHYFGESFYSDSGRSITCLALTRFENEGGENQTTIWRRFFLDVAMIGSTGLIQGQVFSNYDSSTMQATFSIYQSSFQSRAEMGVVGKSVAAQISHSSASLPILINGYSWAKRGLRNV